MALKKYKPTTASMRHTILVDRSELHKGRSLKRLTKKLNKSTGKNNQGRITTRHKVSKVKKLYRIIDLKRDNYGITGVVDRIEYDPNRSAFIALIKYSNGDWRYILAPNGLKVGAIVQSGADAPVSIGNAMPLSKIPQGTYIHAVSIRPNEKATIGLAAGTTIQLMGAREDYVQLKMPSGEIRLFKNTCYATIGTVSNPDRKNEKLGKAGRKVKRGIKPTVRGVAMSYKHPHGAGQGKSGRHGTGGPKKDIYGNTVGTRTRKKRNPTNKFIVKRRTEKNKFRSFKTIV